jgi:hypothetical protein
MKLKHQCVRTGSCGLQLFEPGSAIFILNSEMDENRNDMDDIICFQSVLVFAISGFITTGYVIPCIVLHCLAGWMCRFIGQGPVQANKIQLVEG